MQHIDVPFPVKLGLGVSAGMIAVSGVFFAALKETTETEKFGYGDVLLWSSLVGGLSGLVSGAIASFAAPQQQVDRQKPVKRESVSDLIELPQPVDALKRLGDTPVQQMANAGTYAFVTGRPLHEYNTMLRQVQEVAKLGQSGMQLPDPVEQIPEEYHLPVPQSAPAQGFNQPRASAPHLHGEDLEEPMFNGFAPEEEEEDLWEPAPPARQSSSDDDWLV